AAIRRAVDIYEALAKENFALYAPALATSLNNLSNRLPESGDRAGGLAAIRRAVEIREAPAEEDFAVYAPDLARSLYVLWSQLTAKGDRTKETIVLLERAVEMIRPFVVPNTEYSDLYDGMKAALLALQRQG